MNKRFVRLISLLLVFCFAAESVPANCGLPSPQRPPSEIIFTDQALTLAVVYWHQPLLHGALAGFKPVARFALTALSLMPIGVAFWDRIPGKKDFVLMPVASVEKRTGKISFHYKNFEITPEDPGFEEMKEMVIENDPQAWDFVSFISNNVAIYKFLYPGIGRFYVLSDPTFQDPFFSVANNIPSFFIPKRLLPRWDPVTYFTTITNMMDVVYEGAKRAWKQTSGSNTPHGGVMLLFMNFYQALGRISPTLGYVIAPMGVEGSLILALDAALGHLLGIPRVFSLAHAHLLSALLAVWATVFHFIPRPSYFIAHLLGDRASAREIGEEAFTRLLKPFPLAIMSISIAFVYGLHEAILEGASWWLYAIPIYLLHGSMNHWAINYYPRYLSWRGWRDVRKFMRSEIPLSEVPADLQPQAKQLKQLGITVRSYARAVETNNPDEVEIYFRTAMESLGDLGNLHLAHVKDWGLIPFSLFHDLHGLEADVWMTSWFNKDFIADESTPETIYGLSVLAAYFKGVPSYPAKKWQDWRLMKRALKSGVAFALLPEDRQPPALRIITLSAILKHPEDARVKRMNWEEELNALRHWLWNHPNISPPPWTMLDADIQVIIRGLLQSENAAERRQGRSIAWVFSRGPSPIYWLLVGGWFSIKTSRVGRWLGQLFHWVTAHSPARWHSIKRWLRWSMVWLYLRNAISEKGVPELVLYPAKALKDIEIYFNVIKAKSIDTTSASRAILIRLNQIQTGLTARPRVGLVPLRVLSRTLRKTIRFGLRGEAYKNISLGPLLPRIVSILDGLPRQDLNAWAWRQVGAYIVPQIDNTTAIALYANVPEELQVAAIQLRHLTQLIMSGQRARDMDAEYRGHLETLMYALHEQSVWGNPSWGILPGDVQQKIKAWMRSNDNFENHLGWRTVRMFNDVPDDTLTGNGLGGGGPMGEIINFPGTHRSDRGPENPQGMQRTRLTLRAA